MPLLLLRYCVTAFSLVLVLLKQRYCLGGTLAASGARAGIPKFDARANAATGKATVAKHAIHMRCRKLTLCLAMQMHQPGCRNTHGKYGNQGPTDKRHLLPQYCVSLSQSGKHIQNKCALAEDN